MRSLILPRSAADFALAGRNEMPGEGERDHPDETAEQARRRDGSRSSSSPTWWRPAEASTLRSARLEARSSTCTARGSGSTSLLGRGRLFRLVGFFSCPQQQPRRRPPRQRRCLDRDFGRGAFDGRRRTLACTALAQGRDRRKALPSRLNLKSLRGFAKPHEDAAFGVEERKDIFLALVAPPRAREIRAGLNTSATASEMQ